MSELSGDVPRKRRTITGRAGASHVATFCATAAITAVLPEPDDPLITSASRFVVFPSKYLEKNNKIILR